MYNMFINNNRASFHLWCKENFVKHQNVSKYYENDCQTRAIAKMELFLMEIYMEINGD